MKFSKDVLEKSLCLNSTIWELDDLEEFEARRLYLYGEINSDSSSDCECDACISPVASIVKKIFLYNREDRGLPEAERKPIILYINSPGGEVSEGFSLVAAMELSKTPIYTVNTGMWCSMAFLIGIAGQKRYSLPFMTFLMHEASGFSFGKISNMEDKIKFDRKFSDSIVREHVLRHSCMSEREYNLVVKNELYLLPEEALKYGFIDEIVSDIDTIL